MKTVSSSIPEMLSRYGSFTYRVSGTSMLPMLRQKRDLVTIVPYDGKGLRKLDVALYGPVHGKNGMDHYVLHRVVGTDEGKMAAREGRIKADRSYTFLGDHCKNKEYNIPESSIVGILHSFERDGKHISVNDRRYRIYSHIWYWFYPVRYSYYSIRQFAARIPWARNCYRRLKWREDHVEDSFK